MARAPGFKIIILLSVVILYVVSITTIFFLFNQFYMTNIKEKLIENNFESAKIAVSILNDEKNRMREHAAEIARDYPLQYALIRNINLYFSNFTLDGKNNKIKEIDKLGYMRVVSKLKQSLNASAFGVEGEKGIAIYDRNLTLMAKTSNLTENEVETWDEPYLKLIRENIENKNVEGGVVSIDSVGLIAKNNGQIYIKGIDDVVSGLGDNRSAAEGAVIVTKKINIDILNSIKGTLGKEVMVFTNDNIEISTANLENELPATLSMKIKRVLEKDGKGYIEMKSLGKELGVSFVPVFDFEGEAVAYIGTGVYLEEVEAIVRESSNEFWAVAALFSIILLGILVTLLWRLFAPFNEIIGFIKEIAKGNYSWQYSKKLGWELEMITESIAGLSEEVKNREEELKKLNYNLEEKVYQRTKDLEETNNELTKKTFEIEEKSRELALKNRELNTAIENLQRMQKQLVENERMASMGALVDGVANQITVPVYEALRSSSYIENETHSLREKIFLKQINEESVAKAVINIENNSSKLSETLGKISEVINSFKQVASDFAENDEKEFNLKYYLDEIASSLFAKLGNTKIKIEMYCERDINLIGHPGAFYHILNNLISNSLYHAFDWNDDGKIIIDISKKYDKVIFSYYDNGKGMPEEVRRQIFEPFFTTAKDKGKSGLGMSIVYNIVTQTIKGTIAVESEPGNGTKVIIEIPLNK